MSTPHVPAPSQPTLNDFQALLDKFSFLSIYIVMICIVTTIGIIIWMIYDRFICRSLYCPSCNQLILPKYSNISKGNGLRCRSCHQPLSKISSAEKKAMFKDIESLLKHAATSETQQEPEN